MVSSHITLNYSIKNSICLAIRMIILRFNKLILFKYFPLNTNLE